jgi:leucyl/phenylalanyl-tRNA--protein transferase
MLGNIGLAPLHSEWRTAKLFIEITPEVLLKAYARGIFHGGKRRTRRSSDGAEMRGIIPLDRFRSRRACPHRALDRFTVTVNRDFDGVLDGCAEPHLGRPRT